MNVEADRIELEAWLILLRAPRIGAAALNALVREHGGARSALAAAQRGTAKIDDAACREWLKKPDAQRIADDIAWLSDSNHHLVSSVSADFPPLLRETTGAPPALFIVGDPNTLWQAQVAIVGSRSASQVGLANAHAFARALARAGLVITSGLAEGIDAAAHTAALDAGGTTIAVLGTGPDVIYPMKHAELADRIARQGALVSEFAPGTPGRPDNFPRRNRIIAGLALGTLVVEAGLRSGSLITARYATEQGRDVFAIPGSIHNPLARGCHRLIRQGAMLIETADEVVAGLAPLAQRLGTELRQRLDASAAPDSEETGAARDPDYSKLLANLGHEPAGVDRLAERTGLPVAALSSMLLVLELEGEVAIERGGAYVRLHRPSSTLST